MNYHKKTINDVDVSGKKVLLRCDFNVPQDKETGAITSDKRIVASLPTIRALLSRGAAVIACSHLGKPKGQRKESLSLAPVAARLSELLGQEVIFAKDVTGEDAKAKAAALQPGQILLLENTRFEPGETKNDPELARKMAAMADVYVSDAFGAVHRAHASTAGVAAYLPAVSGFLIQKELEIIGGALANPKRPLVAVLGEEALEPATQEAIQAQVDQISAMMETWKNRDVAGFEKIYNKEAILESDDELNSKLFTDRDPGMIQYAADYLSQEGSHTGLMVVGAGHMVGDTGIVQGLIDQGYTVEVVPTP